MTQIEYASPFLADGEPDIETKNAMERRIGILGDSNVGGKSILDLVVEGSELITMTPELEAIRNYVNASRAAELAAQEAQAIPEIKVEADYLQNAA